MRRIKYGNKKTEIHGIKFDSKKEADRYLDLVLLEKAGEISDLEIQPRFALERDDLKVKIRSKRYPNGRQCHYTADFSYIEQGQQVIEDVKGMITDAAKLRIAVFEALYGVVVRIT